MSVRIFQDVEESLAREVRRITFHDTRTVDQTVLEDTYDPFTGELIQTPIEPSFFDSSADAHHIQYPNFTIRLMKTKEDRQTGRVVPQYGKWCRTPAANSPKAFEIVTSSSATVNVAGADITSSIFQIAKIQPGMLIRLLGGNNVGTYIVDSVTKSAVGDHTITVSSTLVESLPSFEFDATGRQVLYDEGVDLNTVQIGDIFEDASAATFNVTAVDASQGILTIDGATVPDTTTGSKVTRTGDILKNTDLSPVKYLVLDPTKPVTITTVNGEEAGTSGFVGVSPEIPLDVHYRIRIDSKSRENHIATLNRVWEEFNPPRTALPVLRRTALSAEQALTADVSAGGSTTIMVGDNSNFNVGETIYLCDDLVPTKREDGCGFQTPFEAKVVELVGTDQIELSVAAPDTFKVTNCAKIVSNCEYRLFMFHFVDHVTKDIEGAQYWVHEFIFMVQIWVDRLEEKKALSTVTDVATSMEDLDGNVIIEC